MPRRRRQVSAYYAIFSLFPLLLVLVAGGSYFLDRQEAYEIVTRLVQNALPVSTQVINENLNEVVEARGCGGDHQSSGVVVVGVRLFYDFGAHYKSGVAGRSAARLPR
jgi:uncharacterized BrkB/YihY/UPF0761 family membrane protein